MPTIILPEKVDDLSTNERSFYDSIMRQIPDGQKIVNARIQNLALYFVVPAGFTQEEFERVGHCLTLLHWNWAELGKPGEREWMYILFPL